MRASDTSFEAERVQVAIWRRLGPSARVAIAVRLSDDVRELARAGIRQRHSHYDDHEVEFALWRMTLGDALFTAAYPAAPRLPA